MNKNQKTENLIRLLEFVSTFLLVYINWMAFFNLQRDSIHQKNDYQMYMGFIDFSLYLILLYSVCYITHLIMNPFITIGFWFFGLIKKERARNLIVAQLFATGLAVAAILIQGKLKVLKVDPDGQYSNPIYIIEYIDQLHIDGEMDPTDFLSRKILMSFFIAFIFSLIFTLSYMKFQEEKHKFSIIISLLVYCLISAFRNNIGGAINPLLYYPISIVVLYFDLELLATNIIVPFIATILGILVACNSLKEYGAIKKYDSNVSKDLELIDSKKMLFEM